MDTHSTNLHFLKALATHLHRYGTSVGRLEATIDDVGKRLGLDAHVWAGPTGLLLSAPDPLRPDVPLTHLLRLSPGSTHLGKLVAVDEVARQVGSGQWSAQEGLCALEALDRQVRPRWMEGLDVACFGLSGLAVVGLFPGTGWVDALFALMGGILVGALAWMGQRWNAMGEALEAVAALMVVVLAGWATHMGWSLSDQVVVVASLVALMPGMTLTTAVAELSSMQLMAGSARFAGAVMVLLKLTFGALMGAGLVAMLWGENHHVVHGMALSDPLRLGLVALGAGAFVVLFRARVRDVGVVWGSVLAGQGVAWAVQHFTHFPAAGIPAGAFVAAMVMTALSNAYARWRKRPGALVRLPGIVMLVPGSLGFRAAQAALDQQLTVGLGMAMSVMGAVVALVAGILMGNLLIPARHHL